MKILFWFMFLVSLSFASVKEGNQFFKEGNYQKALEAYQEARKKDPANPLLFYNIGVAEYKLGNYEAAIQELGSAARMPDSSLAAKASYNLANAYFRAGEKEELSKKIELWRSAIAHLKKAVDLNPDFENAKKNAEIMSRLLKEAIDEQKENNQNNSENQEEELSENAKAALAKALQFVYDGNYKPAKELLEQTMAEDPKASKLAPYIQRIDDIIEINAGRKPKAKIDASNADNDLEVI